MAQPPFFPKLRHRALIFANWFVMGLIVYSIITLSIETLPDLSPATRRFLAHSEVVVTIAFTIEYLLRLALARHRLDYALSFYGLIDLLAILPFYLSLGVDLRALRAFRLLRVFRLLKLARYHRAADRFGLAIALIKPELVLFLCVTGILLYLSALGIYYFEHDAQPAHFQSVFHSLWWAVVTLTTVGYGDVYPVTLGGKIFASLVLIIGLGVVAVPAGLMASALSKASKNESEPP
jgi:voltage-gated potassium channel